MAFNLPRSSNTLSLIIGISDTLGTVSLNNASLSVSPCGPPCSFGTEVQPGAAAVNRITEDLLTSWLSPIAATWLLPIFAAFVGFDLLSSDVCASIPPVVAIDLSTLNATAATVKNILYAVAWPHLCRCTAGTPTPSPPPPFQPIQPPGWPPAVSFNGSNVDVCATLVQIQSTLLQLQTVLGQDLGLTTLIQRYQVPFSFIPGATHGPLSGKGTFQVPRVIGLRLRVVSRDPNRFVIQDQPPYLWDLGFVSATNGSEILLERRVNREFIDWLPIGMALATTIGYSLTNLTSVTIQELYAEP